MTGGDVCGGNMDAYNGRYYVSVLELFGMCGGSVEVKVGVLKGMFIHAFKDVDLKGI